MPSFEVDHLTKSFGPRATAVRDLHFRYEGTGAVGCLGPNGAGKSTTLKLLVGLLRPTRGRALLNGVEARHDRKGALWDVGVLIETPEPYPTQTVGEALALVGRLRGLSAEGTRAEVARLADALRLPRLERRCGTLSKGQRQRVVLAAAWMGDPPLLLLDEPASGLDPAERVLVRGWLARMKRDHLVFLVSHQVSDVAEVCDELLILDRGRLLLKDTVAHATTSVRVREIDVEFESPVPLHAFPAIGPGGGAPRAVSERTYRFSFDGSAEARERILDACRAIGPVIRFSPSQLPLEAVYLDALRAASAK